MLCSCAIHNKSRAGVAVRVPETMDHDQELKKWLKSRKLPDTVVKALDKERLLSVDLISQLREDDLQSLRTQYSLSMGHFVELRAARDAIIRGEFASAVVTEDEERSSSSQDAGRNPIDSMNVSREEAQVRGGMESKDVSPSYVCSLKCFKLHSMLCGIFGELFVP